MKPTIAILLAMSLHAAAPAAPEAPVAPREPVDVTVHGDTRSDAYAWLRRRDDPRVRAYLEAENGYADAWFAPRAALKQQLYDEMLARIKQDDEAVPYRKGRWWYSTRTVEGGQYPLHVRRAAVGRDRHYDAGRPEQVLLDLNAMARGRPFLSLGARAVSRDGTLLAYTTDETGGRDYVLHVKDLAADRVLDWSVPEVSGVAWANDNRTLYYVTMDAVKRSDKLWRHVLGSAGPDRLLYEERDELFDLGVAKTRDDRYIVVSADSKDATELRVLDAGRPNARLRTVFARRPEVEASLDHRRGQFYLRLNDTARNFRVVRVDARRPDLAHAEELVAPRPDLMVEDVDVFARHLVVTERVRGALQLRVIDLEHGGEHAIAFDEAAYTVHLGANAEADTTTLRFAYESFAEPPSTWDYDMVTRERVLRKRQPVLGGFDSSRYASERLTARAADGTEVPVSLVYRKDRRTPGAPQPLLLHGYGAYGIPSDPWFSSARVSVLDRGVIVAVAHVRGGGDLGRTWYEAGKLAHKMNSFTDFVACAQALVEGGFTAPDRLAIEGGSAGGLLVTAAVNLRPDLFRAVLADVPFVDVVNTMLDESIPLTIGEFIEWGNPKAEPQYRWLRAYSPYDNLRRGAYPAMLVRTGLNDSQVAYWEPAKYVAKLRTLKTDGRPLLLRVNLEVGHGGASGRFDALKEVAEDYAFLLVELGLAQ
ncbi:MAG: S9 family peptidase [Betaproteobacteria bacterium]